MWVFFDHAERLSPRSVQFFFRPEQPLRYTPGQFVALQVPHTPMDERGNTRWFTLTSVPWEPLLSIAVTFPQICSTYKQALQMLQPGVRLHLSDPLGDFVLPKVASVPMVWMAGGIGAASFVSMAKTLARAGEQRAVTLFQSARQPQDLLFSNHWAAAHVPVYQSVTGTPSDWHGRSSRFAVDDLLGSAPAATRAETLFYISGTEAMVNEICAALVGRGVNAAQLVREAFTGY
jgi:ferredoxin-NADP reductase